MSVSYNTKKDGLFVYDNGRKININVTDDMSVDVDIKDILELLQDYMKEYNEERLQIKGSVVERLRKKRK